LTRRAPSSNSGNAGNYEDRIGSPVYEVPRDQLTRERVSPASSSGFSSGSDYQETSGGGGGGRVEYKQTAAVKSADTNKYSAAVPAARLAAAASRESVLAELEWDDAGIELNEDVMAGQFWLENSILRYCTVQRINMNVVF
jgi:hypothetical protein